MKNPRPMSRMIISVYLLGAMVLLSFYGAIFYHTIMYTENQNSERRLALVAPYHFMLFSQGSEGEIQIDPMLKIYDRFEILPHAIKQMFSANWQGISSFHFEDDSEYNVYAQQVMTNKGLAIVYAVEDVEAIEWNDTYSAIFFQTVIFGLGLLLFIIAAFFIVKMASRISHPFSSLAEQLERQNHEEYTSLSVDGRLSLELVQMLTSINNYRKKISDVFSREQAFTRYVSHELRTPMTVIRGGISILRRFEDEKVQKQTKRIDNAVIEMEQLVNTFLLLARNEDSDSIRIDITDDYIQSIVSGFEATIQANKVIFHQQLQCNFYLNVQPLLMASVINNLLKNAINSSVDGEVNLFISPQKIDVIDTGVGLDTQPRGYEGFGIGLKIVRDICKKYHWQFSLKNNPIKGCTATVLFYPKVDRKTKDIAYR
tara:strand:- start:96454 stop:97737 length:1284 start_codon:yes stop_codon:yes gene_type:complete